MVDCHTYDVVLRLYFVRFPCGYFGGLGGLRIVQVSKAWEEVASVDVVGESIVIGRYMGGNISLKATVPSSRYSSMASSIAVCTYERVDLLRPSAVLMTLMLRSCHTDSIFDKFQPYIFAVRDTIRCFFMIVVVSTRCSAVAVVVFVVGFQVNFSRPRGTR